MVHGVDDNVESWQPKFTVKLSSDTEGKLLELETTDMLGQVVRQVCQLQDSMVRERLVELGWIPPPQSAVTPRQRAFATMLAALQMCESSGLCLPENLYNLKALFLDMVANDSAMGVDWWETK